MVSDLQQHQHLQILRHQRNRLAVRPLAVTTDGFEGKLSLLQVQDGWFHLSPEEYLVLDGTTYEAMTVTIYM